MEVYDHEFILVCEGLHTQELEEDFTIQKSTGFSSTLNFTCRRFINKPACVQYNTQISHFLLKEGLGIYPSTTTLANGMIALCLLCADRVKCISMLSSEVINSIRSHLSSSSQSSPPQRFLNSLVFMPPTVSRSDL